MVLLTDSNSTVGIATGYGLDGSSSVLGRGKRFISTSQRPDRLWGPPSLLGEESFPGVKASGAWS
jgi:hypothetical protein